MNFAANSNKQVQSAPDNIFRKSFCGTAPASRCPFYFAMKTLFLLLTLVLFSFSTSAQDKTTGGVKGKIRLTNGNAISGVLIEAQQNEKEIARGRTDKNGDFTIVGLKPGVYDFLFTKDGLAQGNLNRIEVKAGEMLKLTKLVMAVDQGKLAIVRGSIFDADGRSIRGARVQISKVSGDAAKKVSEIYSSQSGEFVFRLSPDAARYRVVVVDDGKERGSKEVEINGAQIYRVVISVKPAS